jgi:aryl-alcohol dehydrogenase-like predicted oxidoreductase
VERRRLGGTGATVGVIGLGTATWGRGTDEAEAAEQVHLLVEAGGDLLDVHVQSPAVTIVGRAVASGRQRDDLFISIRVPASSSQRSLLSLLDGALGKSALRHADLWTVEGWDADLPWEELVAAMTIAVSSGRARYVGLAPPQPWHGALIGAGLALHPQRVPLAAVTVPYSLLDRAGADAMAEVCDTLPSGLLAAAPLAGGVLTGKYRHATPADSRGAGERFGAHVHHYRGSWARPAVDGLCAAAEGLGASPSALALAWVLGRPGVSACITGARTVHQWRGALSSAEASLPPEIRAALDEVSAVAAGMGHDGGTGLPGE